MRSVLAPRLPISIVAALTAALLVALATAPLATAGAPSATAAAKSKTLRDKKTGFRVKAPKGSKLKRQKSGVYLVRRRGARFAIAPIKTSQSPAAAGAEIARALGATAAKVKSSKSSWSATLSPRKGGAATAVAIRRRGKRLIVGRTTGRAGAAAGPRATAAITTAEIAVLRQLVRSADGGRAIVLGSGIPLRRFTAPDGSATAFVPDRPGWTYSGAKGGIDGSNANEGALAFGIAVPILTPGSFGSGTGQFVESPFVGAATAVRTTFPAFIRRAGGGNVAITGLTPFPGAQQLLGANFDSGFFAVTMNVNGRAFDGVMLMGTAPIDGQYWLMYYSFVIVRRGADARLGPALLEAWASWNPSADQQRRRNETLQAILTTQLVGGGPIDQGVFDAAAAKWSAYIRE
jgi:hypothetical protein